MPSKEWTDGRGHSCKGGVPGVADHPKLGIKLWLHEGPREAWVTLCSSSFKGYAGSSLGVMGEDDIALPWKILSP